MRWVSTRCCCRWRSASDGSPAETTPTVRWVLQQEEFGLIKFSSFISSCDLEVSPAGSGCGRASKSHTPALLSALHFSLGLLLASWQRSQGGVVQRKVLDGTAGMGAFLMQGRVATNKEAKQTWSPTG